MRILAFACAFAPGIGSESGSGWVWARLLASLGETWIITSASPPRAETIEAKLRDLVEGRRIHVVYADIPKWAQRIVGESEFMERVSYFLWQIAALRVARRLQKKRPFDLVWHLTWANVWIGSLACFVGPRLVLGPVGGGVSPPWRLVPTLGWRGAAFEISRAIGRGVARHFNVIAHVTWNRARLILVQNPETRDWLPKKHHSKTVVFPNAVLEESVEPRTTMRSGRTTALFVGRLLPLKGVSLALEAIALLPEWKLLICGAGPDEERLRHVARKLGIEARVEFLGWQQRDDVLRLMRDSADVFLFPSLHDEGSWVVAEALAQGLPVVCLDRGGPAVLAGGGVRTSTPAVTVRRLAEAVRSASSRPVAAPPRTDLESSRRRLAALLREAGLLPDATPDRDDPKSP